MKDLKQAIQAALKYPPHEQFYGNLHAKNLESGAVYRRHAGINVWVARDHRGDAMDPTMSARQVDKLLAAGIVEPCGSLAEPRDAIRLANVDQVAAGKAVA